MAKFHKVYSDKPNSPPKRNDNTGNSESNNHSDENDHNKVPDRNSHKAGYFCAVIAIFFFGIFESAQGDWSSIGVKVLLELSALLAAAWFVEHQRKEGWSWKRAVGWSVATWLTFTSVIVCWWLITPIPAFSIVGLWSEAYGESAGTMWTTQNNSIAPIRYAYLASFTNLRNVPMMIDSYFLETENAKGTWELSSFTYPIDGTIFYGQTLKDVGEWKYVSLESAMQNVNIEPNQTVRGWIFFTKFPPTPCRMTIKDTIGESFTEAFTPGFSKSWAFQPMLMEPVKKHVDISAIPMSN